MNPNLCTSEPEKQYSIYIHLPFCAAKCPYCDFCSVETEQIPFDAYSGAVASEWELSIPFITGDSLLSVYIGGGTPSLWPARRLAELLAQFDIEGDVEVTVEINPGDADAGWFDALAWVGVNRFSIGVQALDDTRLAWMGRRHDARAARAAVEMAVESGARSVGVDLIYGTPGQDEASLVDELHGLAETGAHHVSAYELTVAEGTPLARQVESGETLLPSQDRLADLWHVVGETLAKRGLCRYEVSNYAIAGHRSRHNTHYWRCGRYVGLGAGAHGFLMDESGRMFRYANAPSVAEYMKALGTRPPEGLERIDPLTYARERVMLALRTSDGFSFDGVTANLNANTRAEWMELVDQGVFEGLLKKAGDKITPTSDGMLRADALAMRFF